MPSLAGSLPQSSNQRVISPTFFPFAKCYIFVFPLVRENFIRNVYSSLHVKHVLLKRFQTNRENVPTRGEMKFYQKPEKYSETHLFTSTSVDSKIVLALSRWPCSTAAKRAGKIKTRNKLKPPFIGKQ